MTIHRDLDQNTTPSNVQKVLDPKSGSLIWLIAVASRLFTLSLVWFAAWFGRQPYDMSSQISPSLLLPLSSSNRGTILHDGSDLHHFILSFYRWDAVHFTSIAQYGYRFEHQFAFFPGLPGLMRIIHDVCFGSIFKINPLSDERDQMTLIWIGVIISNVSFILSVIVFYKLSMTILQRKYIAKTATILYCFNPASVFMSSPYSESPFALLSFLGMLACSRRQFILASLYFAGAGFMRSNGIVYSGFFVWYLIIDRREELFIRGARVWNWFWAIGKTAILSIITVSPFVFFQFYGYQSLCEDGLRPWCTDRPFPLVYSFVQKEYWNNGFLNYFRVSQIPNFMIATPYIILSISGLVNYAKNDWRRVITLNENPMLVEVLVSCRLLSRAERRHRKSNTDEEDPFTSAEPTLPFMYLWAVLLVYCTFWMHVQVIIRFFSAMPPLFWWCGAKCCSSARPNSWILVYFLVYGSVSIVLYANFYPPA